MDDHPVSLKVMRLYKPSMRQGSVSILGGEAVPTMIVLPESFGNIFAGQRFSSYISVCSKVAAPVRNVVLTAELQTKNKRIMLRDRRRMGKHEKQQPQQERQEAEEETIMNQDAGEPRDLVEPGDTIDLVIDQELLAVDIGPHILRVCVEYDGWRPGERKSLRKFYRFHVAKALSFHCVVFTDHVERKPDEAQTVMIQVEVHNQTKDRFLLYDTSFAPGNGHQTDVSGVILDDRADDGLNKPDPIPPAPPVLDPDGKYNFVVKVISAHPFQDGQVLGQVQLKWRTGLGECGSVVSQPLQWSMKNASSFQAPVLVKLSVENNDRPVKLGEDAQVICVISNQSTTPMDLCLRIANSESSRLLFKGPIVRILGRLQPGQSVSHAICVVALSSGFHDLNHIYIVDMHTGTKYQDVRSSNLLYCN